LKNVLEFDANPEFLISNQRVPVKSLLHQSAMAIVYSSQNLFIERELNDILVI